MADLFDASAPVSPLAARVRPVAVDEVKKFIACQELHADKRFVPKKVRAAGKKIAVVDSSIEAHMLDLLIYRENAKLPQAGAHDYQIAGKSCLAGDIFGDARFDRPLAVGDRISVQDAAGYTMVKKNWFNGVAMPAIAIRDEDGTIRTVRQFTYDDYKASLS